MKFAYNPGMKEIFAILAALSLSTPALADIHVEGAAALTTAVSDAPKGETIIIAAGRYDLTDLKLPRDVRLLGEGEVVFYSTRPTEKGILNPLRDASVHVENIRFEGARAPDLNGAGIRHDGLDLTVVNCLFFESENGILATGQDGGVITIIGSAFIDNGYGDGYSHGIYVASGDTLDIASSRFSGTRIGHHVKSLATTTRVKGSTFDDADGKTSYAIDATRGGVLEITGNSFIQAADGDNGTLFNFDESRGGEAASLVITGNRIVNRSRYGRFLRNETNIVPVLNGNEITNEAGGRLKLD
ncbi:MAG: right-handed parallel beta-helix repeat-containing protein [Pseudomonadota bacterium]